MWYEINVRNWFFANTLPKESLTHIPDKKFTF